VDSVLYLLISIFNVVTAVEFSELVELFHVNCTCDQWHIQDLEVGWGHRGFGDRSPPAGSGDKS